MGLRDLGRSADRVAAHQGPGEFRTGPANGAGPCLLAAKRRQCGPGDLERRHGHLPPGAARPHDGTDFGRGGIAHHRPSGRHLRASGRPDLGRRPHPAAGRLPDIAQRCPGHAGQSGQPPGAARDPCRAARDIGRAVAGHRRHPAGRRAGAPAACQRSGRLHGRRRGIRHYHDARPAHARPLGQRHRQCRHRHRTLGKRASL
ncbi:hypothetical protein D3C71_1115280 [compost metagenome]